MIKVQIRSVEKMDVIIKFNKDAIKLLENKSRKRIDEIEKSKRLEIVISHVSNLNRREILIMLDYILQIKQ